MDPRNFGAHSLRAGFMNEAARSGTALGDAMALSGHASQQVAGEYFRETALLRNPASRLLDKG